MQRVLENALCGVETSNYELDFETRGKEVRHLLVNATTRRDAENNITGVVGVAQDVTESAKNDRGALIRLLSYHLNTKSLLILFPHLIFITY